MSNNEGWIKLHRSIADNWLWQQYPFSEGQAWIDLLLLANHEDKKIAYKGEIITCERGTVNRSILQLSERWHWDRHKTRRFLDLLESDNMVSVSSTTHRTTISIVNWGFFQDCCTTDSTTDSTTNAQPMVQQVRINKNDKNDKNDKNNNIGAKSTRFVPPTIDEVREYCNERNNGINPEAFVNFYESKGWMVGRNKMMDWKSAVRTWEQKRKDTLVKKNSFTEMIHTDYDFDEIERSILG